MFTLIVTILATIALLGILVQLSEKVTTDTARISRRDLSDTAGTRHTGSIR